MATSAVQSVLVKRSSEEAGLNELCSVKEEPDHVDSLPTTEEEANADVLDDGEPLFHLDVDDGCEPDTDDIPENEKTTDSEAAADLERLEKMVNEGDAGAVKKEEDEQDGAREGEGVGCSEGETEGNSGRSPKKPRLVWTSELHARFMNAVNHLGIKNAVPTTILKLMNVEGMTRENVASHLQKYRLYVKRMAGLPPGARLPSEPMLLPANGLAHIPTLHSGLVPATSALSVPVYVRQPAFLSSYQSRQGVASGTSVRPILPAPYFASNPGMPQLVQTISPYQGGPATHVVVGGPHQGMPPPVLMRSYSATTPLASPAPALTHSYPMSTAVGVPVASAPMTTFYQQPYQIATGVPPSAHMTNQPMQLYAPYGSQPATGQPACMSSSWNPSVTANPLPDTNPNNAVTGSPAVQPGQPAAPMGIPIMQGRPLSHVHSAPVMHTSAQPTYQSWGAPAATLQPLQVMGAPTASGLMVSSGNEAEGLPVTTVAPPPVAPGNVMPDGCLPLSQPGAGAAAQAAHSLPPEPAANGFELQSAFVPLALEGNGECGSSTDGCPVELALEHHVEGEGDGAGTLENGDRSTLTLSEPDDGGVWSHSWTQDWCGDPTNGRHL